MKSSVSAIARSVSFSFEIIVLHSTHPQLVLAYRRQSSEMVRNFLKSGFLFLLLVALTGKEFHTHSEKEIRTFSQPSYSAHQDSKQPCPICQFQRLNHSLWDSGAFTCAFFPFLMSETSLSFKTFLYSFDFDTLLFGRAPPALLPLS